MLERGDEGIKLLPPAGKKLDAYDSRDSGRDSGKGCGVADKHNGVQTVKLA